MDLGFRGEVADLYHQYRRGHPPAVIDSLVESFGLTGDDTVVDLGCYSALPVDELPAPDRRPSFAEQVRCALEPYAPFTEHVRVATLIGRTHAATP